MAKSNIIKELVNGKDNIEDALNRLLVIAYEIDNEKLVEWVKHELNGYPDDANIPEYRECICANFIYTGIKGNLKIENAPLMLQNILEKDSYEKIIKLNLTQGITSTPKQDVYKDCTYLADFVYENDRTNYISISQIIPRYTFENIRGQIKTILIEIMLKLEKEYGNLDSLDIDTSSKTKEEIEAINTTVINYIFNDNSITIGNDNNIKNSDILTGGDNNEQE